MENLNLIFPEIFTSCVIMILLKVETEKVVESNQFKLQK